MVNERSSTSKVGRVMRSFESHTLSSVDGPLPSFLAGGRPSLVCARPGAASCPPEYEQGEVRRGALCVCGVRLPDGRDNDDVHCHQDEVRRASSGISTTATHGRPAAGWRAAPPFRAAVPSELRGRRQRHPRASVITFRTASGRTSFTSFTSFTSYTGDIRQRHRVTRAGGGLARGVLADPRRRTQRHSGGVLGTRERVLPQPWGARHRR